MIQKRTESLFYIDYDHYTVKLYNFIRFDPKKHQMSFKGKYDVFSTE